MIFLKERIEEYLSYGLTTIDGYSEKLIEIRRFIVKRFAEFKKIIISTI